jgi:translation initiation factor 2 alpha subunit (eIF-2alpha)
MKRVWSMGQIGKELGAEPHRIRYAIESRGVQSIGRVGNTHCYDQDGLERIRAALGEIERGKEATGQVASEAAAVPAGA